MEHLYYTKTDLLKRGWTVWAIKKYLISADETKTNAYKKQTLLFLKTKVENIESTEQFKSWKKSLDERRYIRKEKALLEKTIISKCFDKLYPLSQWQTNDWVEFKPEYYGMNFSKEIKPEFIEEAVQISCKMLSSSYWIPLNLFVNCFEIPKSIKNISWAENSSQHCQNIQESLIQNGWQGIPITSCFSKLSNGKLQRLSGNHRSMALWNIFEQGKIDFKVPVFDLRKLHKCVNKNTPYYSEVKDFYSYLDENSPYMAGKFIARQTNMLYLVTGLDY